METDAAVSACVACSLTQAPLQGQINVSCLYVNLRVKIHQDRNNREFISGKCEISAV